MPAPTARPGTPKGCAFGLPRPLITFQRRMARDLQSRFERAGRAWPISGRRRPRRPRPFRTLGRSAPSDEGKIPQPRASDEGAAPSSRGRRGRRGRHRPPSSSGPEEGPQALASSSVRGSTSRATHLSTSFVLQSRRRTRPRRRTTPASQTLLEARSMEVYYHRGGGAHDDRRLTRSGRPRGRPRRAP